MDNCVEAKARGGYHFGPSNLGMGAGAILPLWIRVHSWHLTLSLTHGLHQDIDILLWGFWCV
eukprot:5253851-Amphidinium_carterae.1